MTVVILAAGATAARAETPIQPGLWERSETITLAGSGATPPRQQQLCLKPGEATLERLLLMSDDEAKARGCKSEVSVPGPAQVKMNLSCPASDPDPAIDATMELKYAPTTFDGTGTMRMKGKDGQELKGTSRLSGKRIGDC